MCADETCISVHLPIELQLQVGRVRGTDEGQVRRVSPDVCTATETRHEAAGTCPFPVTAHASYGNLFWVSCNTCVSRHCPY